MEPEAPVAGGQTCSCCVEGQASNPSATALEQRLASAATTLGLDDTDRRALLATLAAGDCRTTHDVMAAQVDARLVVAQHRIATTIGDTAGTHAAASSESSGMPSEVVDLHRQTVTALDGLARLQAAAAQLRAEPDAGGCSDDCPCTAAATGSASSPDVPQSDIGLMLAPATGPGDQAIACTLDGGIAAMQARVGEWQQVVGRATGRRPVEGGVTLTYDHDSRLTVELARLAAAEYACCSFFTFALTVGPTGLAFAVTAPEEARDVVVAVFGAYGPVPAGAR
jgi:hypothetical protein